MVAAVPTTFDAKDQPRMKERDTPNSLEQGLATLGPQPSSEQVAIPRHAWGPMEKPQGQEAPLQLVWQRLEMAPRQGLLQNLADPLAQRP